MAGHGLEGFARATKTDQFKDGTLWLVPEASFSGSPLGPFILAALEEFRASLPSGAMPDFLLPGPWVQEAFSPGPASAEASSAR